VTNPTLRRAYRHPSALFALVKSVVSVVGGGGERPAMPRSLCGLQISPAFSSNQFSFQLFFDDECGRNSLPRPDRPTDMAADIGSRPGAGAVAAAAFGPVAFPVGMGCVPFAPKTPGFSELWRQWRAVSRGAPPFLHPEFFAMTRLLVQKTGGTPVLAVGRKAGQVAGVLPLLRVGGDLCLLRSDHSPRYDFWGDSVALGGVWETLRSDKKWHRLVFAHVPADSPLATEFPWVARRSGCIARVSPSPGVRVFGLQGFEKNLNHKFRTNILRCERKIGGLSFERYPLPTRLLFDEALSIEAMVWKGAAGTAIQASEDLRRFYYALVHLFGRRGQASLNFVSAAGKRLACLFTLEDEHTLFAAKIGYDHSFSVVSPGHLMILHTARDAEQRGLRVFDFLGQDSEWKRRWTDDVREHVTVVVYRPSVLGYANCALREWVKPRLPEKLVAQIRNYFSRSR